MVYYSKNNVDEFEVRHYKTQGVVNNFKSYPCVTFHIPPLKFTTHELDGWKMKFRQKTVQSRMYVHFYNNKGFGFRVRLPAKGYRSIDDIMNALHGNLDYSESEDGLLTVSYKELTFEDVLKREQERIQKEIGDWAIVKEPPKNDNVIDFSRYLKEPKGVVLGMEIAI